MSHRRTPSKAPQEAKKAEELKHGLTDVEIGELREAFSLYDKDGEGEIAAANLQSIMNRLDPTLQPTTDELQELISEYDSTGEGNLGFQDFLQMMAGFDLPAVTEVREAFNVFDRKKNQQVTAEDLDQVMESLGEKLTKEEVLAMVSTAGDDGKIHFPAFVQMMQSAEGI